MGVVIGWLTLQDDSSGAVNARQRPPADNVLIEVGMSAVARPEDAPMAPPGDIVGFPDPDRHWIGGRGLRILNPDVHRGAVPWCQPDGIPVVHDGSFPA